MRFKGLVVCVALLAGSIAPASATMRIAEDRGGQIGQYLQAFTMLRSSGERVVIDGNCLSACTLVLGMIPREQMCATPRARFGFHAAWMPDLDGRPVTSPIGTQALWNIYPSNIRRWIGRHGGLSRRMIYLEGPELGGYIASCDRPVQRPPLRSARAHSDGRYAARPVHYTGAIAASDRH